MDGNKVIIDRPVYDQDLYVQNNGPLHQRDRSPRKRAKTWAGNCTPTCLAKSLLNLLPCIKILKNYSLKDDLLSDVIAGITVGIMQIPQGLAYGQLASLTPVYGLYTAFMPVIMYFFFGTSKHISFGPFAIASLMLATTIDKSDCGTLFPTTELTTQHPSDSTVDIYDVINATTSTGSDDVIDPVMQCKLGVAMAVTLMVGIIQLAMGILQLGFISVYLSEPLTRALTCAAACHVFTSQITAVFGLDVPRQTGVLKLIYTYIEIFKVIDETVVASLITSIVSMLLLWVIKEYLSPRFKRKFHLPIPGELIVVILSTVACNFGKFNEKYGVEVVNEIPTGLPSPEVPSSDRFGEVITDALSIAIVTYAINISMAKLFAKKHSYNIDPNQELIGYSLASIVGSFFLSVQGAAAMSRSSVMEGAGARTQVTSLVACAIILVVLYGVGPLLEQLPTCVLASIVIVALKGMFLHVKDIPRLWRIDRIDLSIWVVTFVATFLTDIDLGLLIGAGFAIITIVFRAQKVHVSLLGNIPDTEMYENIKVYPKATEMRGVKIFRFESSLHFANQEYFLSRLYSKTGVEPARLKRHRLKCASRLGRQGELQSVPPCSTNGINPHPSMTGIYVAQGQDVIIEENETHSKSELRYIILDCSMIAYVDSVAVSLLTQIISEYKEVDITVFLAGCKDEVLETIEHFGLFNKNDYMGCLYKTVHDAFFATYQKQNLSSSSGTVASSTETISIRL